MLEKFETYQVAKELYRLCEIISTKGYIKDQLMRAALSVVLNLSEGSAKPTAKDRRRFYAISYASVREVQAILDLIGRSKEYSLANRLGGMLYRLRQNAF